jgi:antitoxin component of RelBE/YafQ-DinJ toxin-antitoxin module
VAIHAAVIVLSLPGLRSEATEANVPLEVLEFRAIREAAQDVAQNYGMNQTRAINAISRLVARYGE